MRISWLDSSLKQTRLRQRFVQLNQDKDLQQMFFMDLKKLTAELATLWMDMDNLHILLHLERYTF